MTAPEGVDIVVYGPDDAHQAFGEARRLYRIVYAEPPYLEDEPEFEDFDQSLPARAKQPGFRMVLAYSCGEGIGFALGHELKPGTRWWEGTSKPLSEDFKTEHPARTFAVIELAVLAPHRRRGLGRALYAHLMRDLKTERSTLLVRPDAEAAKSAYTSWGYVRLGRIQPFEGGPTYDLMVEDRRRARSSRQAAPPQRSW